MGGQMWWYVARAGGIVAWLLLLASTVCGLLLATRRTGALNTGIVVGACAVFAAALLLVWRSAPRRKAPDTSLA
jgi:hypothetical protein